MISNCPFSTSNESAQFQNDFRVLDYISVGGGVVENF